VPLVADVQGALRCVSGRRRVLVQRLCLRIFDDDDDDDVVVVER